MENRLITISTIDILGTALTWTGLPVFMFNLTHSYMYTVSLYATGTISGILSSLYSGYLVDRYSKKTLMLNSLQVNFILIIILYFSILKGFYWMVFPVMIISQCLGAVSLVSQDIWFNSIINKENLTKEISRKNSWIMTAKTIGFTTGPLVFGILGIYAILFDALTFGVSALLLSKINYTSIQSKQSSSLQSILKAFIRVISHQYLRTLWIVSIFDGIITPTILSLSTYILKEQYNATDEIISGFWLVGGIASVFSNVFLLKSKILQYRKVYLILISIIFITGGLIIMSSAQTWVIYLLGFLFLTLGNPLVFNLLRTEVFLSAPIEMKGKITTLMNSSGDFASLAALSISWFFISNYGILKLLLLLAGISLIRIFTFFKSWPIQKKHQELNSCSI